MTITPWSVRRLVVLALALGMMALASDLVSSQARPRWTTAVMADGREVVAGEVLVRFRDPAGAAAQQQLIEQQIGADEVETVGRRGLRRVRARRMTTEALLALLRANPDVELVEPNYVIRIGATPNDPSFNSLWGLLNFGQVIQGVTGIAGADTSATFAWETTRGSRNSVVGVVDTGIDYTHPDLAANVWSAPAPFSVTIGGVVITCAAGTHGFNAIANTCDPMDDHNHGTHVAGTIGAVGNNGVGIAGVNWVASMMGLKFLSAGGSGSTSDAIKAIEFAIQARSVFGAAANVRILSNSWGGGGYSVALKDAIDRAGANGMLFVAAAGNSGVNTDLYPHYPSSYTSSNLVAVAATDNRDRRAGFSNYGGASVHLGAPGVSILSTIRGNGYAYYNGTSMATPHVSGAAALVLAQCPNSTVPELKTALLSTVDPVAALAGITTTGGRLNADDAIRACRRNVESVALTSDVASPRAAGTTVTWTAAPQGGTTPYAYKWWIYDGSAWTMAADWSATNTLAWTPASAGNYYVGVWVRSAGNTSNVAEVAHSIPYQITNAAQVVSASIAPDRAAPQPAGTSITWTASQAGGVAPYQYKWWIFNGSAWAAMTGWTGSSTFVWTPNVANNNYAARVWIRSAGNAADAPEAVGTSAAYAITAAPRVTNVTIAPDLPSPQPIGAGVTFTATPTGGTGPYQYKWVTYNGASWDIPAAWTSSNTRAWNTNTVGKYLIGVWVKSAGNTADAAEHAVSIPFERVARPPVTSVVLAFDKAAPQLVGTTIRVTATAAGGVAPLEYHFTASGSGLPGAQSGWSTANTFDWTPSAGGTWSVAVSVRSGGNTAVEASASQSYAVTAPPITAVALTANKSAPQSAHTVIAWTAAPVGGTAPYQYKWFEFDGANWTVRQNWTDANVITTAPAAANPDYAVRVWARSAGNTADAAEAVAAVAFPITEPAPITNVTVTASAASPQLANTTIGFTNVIVTGGSGSFNYRWDVFNGSVWTLDTGWSWVSNYNWRPAAAGNYQVRLRVRNAAGAIDAADYTLTMPYVITSPTVTGVTLVPDRASPQAPGTTITWNATPSGGIAPHQYKWWVYNGVSWSMATGWTASNSFAWTPVTAGTYAIGVWVKSAANPSDAAETPVSSVYTIAGIAPPRVGVVTLTADRAAPQLPGTTITWTAGATGGTAPYEFKWALYDGVAWTNLTAWTTQNTYAWTANVANAGYIVRVWARSAGNAADAPEASQQAAFPIGPASTRVTAVSLTPSAGGPQPPGALITWTATPTGGTAPHQYKWWIHDGASWTMVAGWTASNQLAWRPALPGNYLVGVWVKSAGNPADAAEVPHSVPFVIQ